VKPLFIGALGAVLCACSSSDFHPYVGQQQKWPTSPGTFVNSQYDVPVYYGYPPRPYTVLGMIEETSHGRHSWSFETGNIPQMKMSAAWFLNVFGLVLSTIAAGIMFYYPPRVRAFTETGAETISWLNNPNPKNAAVGKRQIFFGKVGPALLGIGFLLQLSAAFC